MSEALRDQVTRLRGDLHRKLGNQIGPEIFKARHLLCSSCSGKGTGLSCSDCDESLAQENTDKHQEIERLREAGSKICEGFDEGYFVRNVHRDGESNWAIKLLPYLRAIAVFAEAAALHTEDAAAKGGGDE